LRREKRVANLFSHGRRDILRRKERLQEKQRKRLKKLGKLHARRETDLMGWGPGETKRGEQSNFAPEKERKKKEG